MYKDYQDALLRHYENRKTSRDLSLNLLQPTPSKIRDECVLVYRSKPVRKDQKMLMSFFDVNDESDILKTVERFDIDRFKPLANYLKKLTGDTEYKNVELLAWLLDFEPRPYDDRHDYAKPDKEADPPENGDEEQGNGDDEGNAGSPSQPKSKGDKQTDPKPPGFKKKLVIISVGLLVTLGLIAAMQFNNKEDKGCMIWVRDHYERVSCDSSGVGAGIVLGLDASAVYRLRKITRPDTLTENDIGKVWYRKRGRDSLDFYTTGGRDPIDPNQYLTRLTPYMFDKYLRKKNSIDSSKTH